MLLVALGLIFASLREAFFMFWQEATDPVCGMRVAKGDDTPYRVHAGTRYWFCSEGCAETFEDQPDSYAPNAIVSRS